MSSEHGMGTWHGTTILMVRKGGKVVIAGDGQVSLGQTVIKNTARKVRPLAKGTVIEAKQVVQRLGINLPCRSPMLACAGRL